MVEHDGRITGPGDHDGRPGGPEPIGARSAESASLLRSPFLWAFLIGIVTITLIRPFLRFEPDPPPVLYTLPPFELTSASGEAFGSADLEGSPYVASFFFTHCPSICPTLMRSVNSLTERLDAEGVEGVRVISISVDPENDSPAVLSRYARRIGADSPRWTLLTGTLGTIRSLLIEGFRVPIGDREERPAGLYDIAHTGKLVLVDAHGNVRGYYDSTKMGLDEVFHRAQHVKKEHRDHHGRGGRTFFIATGSGPAGAHFSSPGNRNAAGRGNLCVPFSGTIDRRNQGVS